MGTRALKSNAIMSIKVVFFLTLVLSLSLNINISSASASDIMITEPVSNPSITSETFLNSDKTETVPPDDTSHVDIESEMFSRTAEFDLMFDRLSLPWTRNDYLPAYKAALDSDLKMLKLISSLGINLDKTDLKTGETPLHAACRRGNIKIFNFILTKVKNKAPLNRAGSTPFHVAVSQGNYDLVLKMLRYGNAFKCRQPDYKGRTPIMTAALNYHENIFRIFKGTGEDCLHKDNSNRSLISLLAPENPCYGSVFDRLISRLAMDREDTIRFLAADISFLLRDQAVINGKARAYEILEKLGVSMEEMIQTPQAHLSNPLMAILESKDYPLYQSLKNNPEINFDINSLNEFDPKFSFFDRCLQSCSPDSVEYLIINENPKPKFDICCIEAAFLGDRVNNFKILQSNYDLSSSVSDEFELICLAGSMKANDIFRYLIDRHRERERELFCQAAVEICSTGSIDSIMNLFINFVPEFNNCSLPEFEEMSSNIYENFNTVQFIEMEKHLNRFKLTKLEKFRK